MEHENQEILRRLDKIQIDINILKNHVIDPDCILTEEEEERLDESLEEFRQGKTTSLEDFKKEMAQVKGKK